MEFGAEVEGKRRKSTKSKEMSMSLYEIELRSKCWKFKFVQGSKSKIAPIFKKQTSNCLYYHLDSEKRIVLYTSGLYFIKVKIILSLRFKINLICYLIKEFMKHSCLHFFYEIVNKISIEVKRNWNLKNSPRLKDDQFFLNPDFKKIFNFYEIGPRCWFFDLWPRKYMYR